VDWFYAENGRQIGPVQDDALQALVRAGTVTGDTLVWHAGLANWQTWSSLGTSVAAPLVGPPGIPGNFCTECGRAFSPEDLMQFGSSSICAECKPLPGSKPKETAPARAQPQGMWCPKCKSFNPATNQFCGECGAAMQKKTSPIAIGCLAGNRTLRGDCSL